MKPARSSEVSKVNTSASVTSLRRLLHGASSGLPSCIIQCATQPRASLPLSLFRVTCLLTGGLIRQLRDRIPSSKIIYFSPTAESFLQIGPLPSLKPPSLAARRPLLSAFSSPFLITVRPDAALVSRHPRLTAFSHAWQCCLVLSVNCQANFSRLFKTEPNPMQLVVAGLNLSPFLLLL